MEELCREARDDDRLTLTGKNRWVVNSALYIHQCGFEHCAPGHQFGPAVRDHYLMHCVLDGEGDFYVGDQQYHLETGQGFLIIPSMVTTYRASHSAPWYYAWVGFNGADAKPILNQCGIKVDRPIFVFDDARKMEQVILTMSEHYGADQNGFTAMSALYGFFSQIYQAGSHDKGFRYNLLDLALDYIHKNYSYPITVESVASHIGVDRSHLFRIFKKELNVSVQEYLVKYRLHHSAYLLVSTPLSITEVMYSSGFNDLANFSKQFRRCFGCSPREYRKRASEGPVQINGSPKNQI